MLEKGTIRTNDDVRGLILDKLGEKRKRDDDRMKELMRKGGGSIRERVDDAVKSIKDLSNLSKGDLRRILEILYAFLKMFTLLILDWIVYPIRYLSDWKIPRGDIYDHGEKPMFARRVRITFEDLGSTFIKLGQVLSMMFVLPWSYISEFSKLCDYLPPEKLETVRKTIEDEIGVAVEDVFDYISPEPVGSASLAQVHFVTLKDGREGVIKVQRPELEEKIRRDIIIIRPIALLLELILKPFRPFFEVLEGIHPIEIVNDFENGTIVEELDFLLEASFQQMYRNALDYWGLTPQLHVPNVYWEYTTKKLLTMERIWFYFKLVDLDIGKQKRAYETIKFLRSIGYDTSANVKKLHRSWFYTLARHGLATLDVHHGNFLFQYDNSYAMVDFGIFFYSGSPSKWGEIGRAFISRSLKSLVVRDRLGVIKSIAYLIGAGDEEHGTKLSGFTEDDTKRVIKVMKDVGEPITKLDEKDGGKGFLTEIGKMMTSGDMIKVVYDSLKILYPTLPKVTRMEDTQVSGMMYMGLNAMRAVMYFGTWFSTLDPSWDMYDEREWFYGYFWDVDGKVPMKRTGELARPILPYSDILIRERTDEEMKNDESIIVRARCDKRYKDLEVTST